MSVCKHCGSEGGYYRTVQMYGSGKLYYNADGSPSNENTNLHDTMNYIESDIKRCEDCGKKIT